MFLGGMEMAYCEKMGGQIEYTQELTLPGPRISRSCIKIKINLNLSFHTSL